MARHNLSSTRSKTSAPRSAFFDRAVSLIQQSGPYDLDVNHLDASFRIKGPSADSALLNFEGRLQNDSTIQLLICLARVGLSHQLPAIQCWTFLSQLHGVTFLPSDPSPDGSYELWLSYSITPDHLNYLQHTSLLQKLAAIEAFAGFLHKAIQAGQPPDVAKVSASYKDSNFDFQKPLPDSSNFSPELLQSLQRISLALLSGNPVLLQHPSLAVLDYVMGAIATVHWKEGIHFGKLRLVQPFVVLLNRVSTMDGIPIFTINQLADQFSIENLPGRYNTLNKMGRAAIILSDGTPGSYPDCFNVYVLECRPSLQQLIFHYLYQFSSTLGITRLQQLSAEVATLSEPFYPRNRVRMEAFLPSLCRLVLRLDYVAPRKLKAQLQATLFHHFD